MRFAFSLLLCLIVTLPALADVPEYLNDRAIRRSIERQGQQLADAKKTIENATLQTQVSEDSTYAAAPPAAFELCQDGKDLYDTVDDGVLVIARLYLCGKCDKLRACLPGSNKPKIAS